jgi:hypothetical protein
MKNLEINEVYTFKLVSGEEVIGKLVFQESDHLVISHPLSVAPNPQGMGLMPSMFTAEHDKPVELNTNTITMYGETADQIRIKYIEATTGITTASKKIVLG